MKKLLVLTVSVVLVFTLSCGFGKKEKEKKPSLLDIGKELVNKAKDAKEKADKKMDVEFHESDDHSHDHDTKVADVALNKTHFKETLSNLDKSIEDMEILVKNIEKKAKDGEFSVMDSLSLVGELANTSLGGKTDYLEGKFSGEQLKEMKTAMDKIVKMYMTKQTSDNNLYSNFDYEKSMKSLDKMKEAMANLKDEASKDKLDEQIKKMEAQYGDMQEIKKNPLKDYSEDDVELFSGFEGDLDERYQKFKSVLEKLGEAIKQVKKN